MYGGNRGSSSGTCTCPAFFQVLPGGNVAPSPNWCVQVAACLRTGGCRHQKSSWLWKRLPRALAYSQLGRVLWAGTSVVELLTWNPGLCRCTFVLDSSSPSVVPRPPTLLSLGSLGKVLGPTPDPQNQTDLLGAADTLAVPRQLFLLCAYLILHSSNT